MKRFALIMSLVLVTMVVSISCDKDKEEFSGIETITFENYPRVDGSTSARALNTMIACKLLGVRYNWQGLKISDTWLSEVYEWTVTPKTEDIPKQYGEDFFNKRIRTSQTHGAL